MILVSRSSPPVNKYAVHTKDPFHTTDTAAPASVWPVYFQLVAHHFEKKAWTQSKRAEYIGISVRTLQRAEAYLKKHNWKFSEYVYLLIKDWWKDKKRVQSMWKHNKWSFGALFVITRYNWAGRSDIPMATLAKRLGLQSRNSAARATTVLWAHGFIQKQWRYMKPSNLTLRRNHLDEAVTLLEYREDARSGHLKPNDPRRKLMKSGSFSVAQLIDEVHKSVIRHERCTIGNHNLNNIVEDKMASDETSLGRVFKISEERIQVKPTHQDLIKDRLGDSILTVSPGTARLDKWRRPYDPNLWKEILETEEFEWLTDDRRFRIRKKFWNTMFYRPASKFYREGKVIAVVPPTNGRFPIEEVQVTENLLKLAHKCLGAYRRKRGLVSQFARLPNKLVPGTETFNHFCRLASQLVDSNADTLVNTWVVFQYEEFQKDKKEGAIPSDAAFKPTYLYGANAGDRFEKLWLKRKEEKTNLYCTDERIMSDLVEMAKFIRDNQDSLTESERTPQAYLDKRSKSNWPEDHRPVLERFFGLAGNMGK